MKKSRIITLISTIALAIFSFTLLPNHTAYADSICNQPGVSEEILRANGCNGATSTDLSEIIVNIITGVVGALGIVAAIVIVIGGVNYMTSAGDSGKLQKAKNTILYAVVGLIISVLAFAIVNFVIRNIIEANGSSSDNNTTNNTNVSLSDSAV